MPLPVTTRPAAPAGRKADEWVTVFGPVRTVSRVLTAGDTVYVLPDVGTSDKPTAPEVVAAFFDFLRAGEVTVPIRVPCPGCSHPVAAPAAAAGLTVRCPRCHTPFTVPGPVEARVVPPPAPARPPAPPPADEERPRTRRPPRDEDEDEPAAPPRARPARDPVRPPPRRPARRPQSRGLSTGAVVGIALGLLGAVGLVVVVVALVLTAGKGEKPGDRPDAAADGGGLAGIVAPLAAGGRPPLPAGWVDFTPPDGSYRVYAPAQPFAPPAGIELPDTRFVGSVYEVHLIQNKAAGCRQHVADISDIEPDRRRSLRPMAEAVAGRHWGTETARRQVTWAGRPTVEVESVRDVAFGNTGGSARAYAVTRVLVTDRRLYTFTLFARDALPADDLRRAFFDSFEPR